MADTHTYTISGKTFLLEHSAMQLLNGLLEKIKSLDFYQRLLVEQAIADDLEAARNGIQDSISEQQIREMLAEEHLRNILVKRYDFTANPEIASEAIKMIGEVTQAANEVLHECDTVENQVVTPTETNDDGQNIDVAENNIVVENNAPQDIGTEENQSQPIKKKLYRDPYDMVMFGVVAGCAHYLNINVSLLRIIVLIVALFTSGLVLALYIVIAILVPIADTESKQRQMFASESKYKAYRIVHPYGALMKDRSGCAKGSGIGCLGLIVLFAIECYWIVNSDFNYCEGHHGTQDQVVSERRTMPQDKFHKLLSAGEMLEIVIDPHDEEFYDSDNDSFSNENYILTTSSNYENFLDSIVFNISKQGVMLMSLNNDISDLYELSCTLPCNLNSCDTILALRGVSLKIMPQAGHRKRLDILVGDSARIYYNMPTEHLFITANGSAEVIVGCNVRNVNVYAKDNVSIIGHENLKVCEKYLYDNATYQVSDKECTDDEFAEMDIPEDEDLASEKQMTDNSQSLRQNSQGQAQSESGSAAQQSAPADNNTPINSNNGFDKSTLDIIRK